MAVLYSLAQRVMLRVDETTLERVEAVAFAALEQEHANLERDFAAFTRAAEPMPVAALRAPPAAAVAAAPAVAAADPTPVGSLGGPRIAAVRAKPVAELPPMALGFADAAPDTYFDKSPIGPANRIVVASLGLVPIAAPDLTAMVPKALPAAEKHDFSYLAYYVFSEVPPEEKPADTVLNSLKDIPVGTPIEEIRHAADAFGLDFGYMKAVAKIESDFDPKQRTGSYIGLYQLSKFEFNRYGDGDILNARDNAIAAAYKIIVEAELFELRTHKKPTLSDLYLIHQQGIQGAEEHVGHPDRIAWESMCATEEGQQKGEKWCKRAIWANTLPEIKKVWKSVDKLTSGAFVSMWEQRVASFYARYSQSAEAAPAK
jgi:hypothetical protein